MRRTRMKGIIIGAIVLLIGAIIALVVRNYVAAEDGDEPLASVSISASYNDGIVTVSLSESGCDVSNLQGYITYDSSIFDCTTVASGANENQAGTVSLLVDPNGTMFYLTPVDGYSGDSSVSLSITTAEVSTDDGVVSLTGDSIGGNRTAGFTIPDITPPGPVYDDPRLSPSEWTLTSSVNSVRLICVHRGYDIVSVESSNPGLVSVSDDGSGTFTVYSSCESDGDATITVTCTEGKTATATIHVVADEVDPVIPVDPDEPINPDDFPDIPVVDGAPVVTPSGTQNLEVGGSIQMSSDQARVTWTSSDTNVAIVDSSTGLISAVGKGAALISVRNGNGKSTSFYVVVNEKGSNGSSSNGTNTSTKTNNTVNGTTLSGKETPTADDPVPQTGESTVEYIVIIGIITFVIATIAFKVKIRKNS